MPYRGITAVCECLGSRIGVAGVSVLPRCDSRYIRCVTTQKNGCLGAVPAGSNMRKNCTAVNGTQSNHCVKVCIIHLASFTSTLYA
jgi:hypothetical protein